MAKTNVKDCVITGASMAAVASLIELVVTTFSFLMQPEYRDALSELYYENFINRRLEEGYIIWK